MCRLSRNLGSSTSLNPTGLSRPVMGLVYLYLYQSFGILSSENVLVDAAWHCRRLESPCPFLLSIACYLCSWRNVSKVLYKQAVYCSYTIRLSDNYERNMSQKPLCFWCLVHLFSETSSEIFVTRVPPRVSNTCVGFYRYNRSLLVTFCKLIYINLQDSSFQRF
jgi:hypothetical protein